MKREKDEYLVPFKGCRLNKRQARQAGFALVLGFLAAAIAVPLLGKTILSTALIVAVTVVAYISGKKLFGS